MLKLRGQRGARGTREQGNTWEEQIRDITLQVLKFVEQRGNRGTGEHDCVGDHDDVAPRDDVDGWHDHHDPDGYVDFDDANGHCHDGHDDHDDHDNVGDHVDVDDHVDHDGGCDHVYVNDDDVDDFGDVVCLTFNCMIV